MPVRKLPLVTDEVYHLVNRGVAGTPIFSRTKDYQRFLETLDHYQFVNVPARLSHFKSLSSDQRQKIRKDLEAKGKWLIEIIAYCLMPNHFHLLVKQLKDGGISEFIRKSSVSYGRYFNLYTERVGPLQQGAFKAVRIETDEQLIHVIRYIHINPYVGKVLKKEQLREYPWSSLSEYLGLKELSLVKPETIKQWFKSPQDHWQFISDEADYQRRIKAMQHLQLE